MLQQAEEMMFSVPITIKWIHCVNIVVERCALVHQYSICIEFPEVRLVLDED